MQRRPCVLPPAETKRREPRGPRLGASPEGGEPGSADRANAVPGAAAARRASRRRGESGARTAPSAAAMLLGRQIPHRGRNAAASPCSRTRPARRGPCIGGHVRPAAEGRGRRWPRAPRCQHRRAERTKAPAVRGDRHWPCRSETPRRVSALRTVPRCPTEDTTKSSGLIRMGVVPAAACGACALTSGTGKPGNRHRCNGAAAWCLGSAALVGTHACNSRCRGRRRPYARVTPSDACGLGLASGAATPASPSSQAKRPGCHDGEAPAVRKPPGSSQAQTSAPLACSGVSAPALPGPKEPPHPRGITQA